MHKSRLWLCLLLLSFNPCVLGLSLFDSTVSRFLRAIGASGVSYDRQLKQLGVTPTVHAASFLRETQASYRRYPNVLNNAPITIILLNWKRLSNVKLLVAHYSRDVPELQEIVIFNNRFDQPLVYEYFRDTGCPSSKLAIFNSDANLYFEARYLACANASTSLCLLQDDDYILHPYTISAMVALASEKDVDTPVVVLPPEEWVRSKYELRMSVGSMDLHTTFYWLGFGALISKQVAQDFIESMYRLEFDQDERKMADNYFSLLANGFPRLLEAKSVPLDASDAFTVGVEGDERNWHYMERAFSRALGGATVEAAKTRLEEQALSFGAAPCLWTPCIFVSNADIYPNEFAEEGHLVAKGLSLRQIEQVKRTLWNAGQREWLQRWPRSSAVDGDATTAWKSTGPAKVGDYIGLDFLVNINFEDSDLVLLVDDPMVPLIGSFEVAVSSNGEHWTALQTVPACQSAHFNSHSSDGQDVALAECSFNVRSGRWRLIRLQMATDHVSAAHWSVWEMWVRQRRYSASLEL